MTDTYLFILSLSQTINYCGRAYSGPIVVYLCSGFRSPLNLLFVSSQSLYGDLKNEVEDPIWGPKIYLLFGAAWQLTARFNKSKTCIAPPPTPTPPPVIFLLTVPRFLRLSACGFIYGVCFLIMCSSSLFILVLWKGCAFDCCISKIPPLIFEAAYDKTRHVWPAKTQISLYVHPLWQRLTFIRLWIARRL